VKPTKPEDKPVASNDKPATPDAPKPGTPAKPDDKSSAGNGKPAIVQPRPVLGDHKPVVVVPTPHDPQRTEKDPVDKTSAMHDHPVSYDGKDDAKKPSLAGISKNDAAKNAMRQGALHPTSSRQVNVATDPVKGAARGGDAKGADANHANKPNVTAAQEPLKGHLNKGAIAGLVAAAGHSCKLFSAQAAPGDKVRLRVQGVDDSAAVMLEGKPLKVLKREPNAWVVQLDKDAKSGRLSVKHGESSVACGKLEVK
jgi:hypothetical protein